MSHVSLVFTSQIEIWQVKTNAAIWKRNYTQFIYSSQAYLQTFLVVTLFYWSVKIIVCGSKYFGAISAIVAAILFWL